MTKARHGGRNPRVTVEELIGEMHGTVDGLVEDGASRADLKLLSRALKELRHTFRFFDGLRKQPKVTVFGSARLTQGSPACRQAESFGRAMVRSGWFVVTGAGEGIMEAAHIGAGREILGFYRAFHSMRYVGRDLVIRIRRPLSSGALIALNHDFPDLLEDGTFSLGKALPEEADEPEVAAMPRIAFRFNSKSHGRLRQLIDHLNESVGDDQ